MCVFIDYQNTYMRAREAFGDPTTEHDYTFGQVFPRRLAVLLRQRAEEKGFDRELVDVRIYRGEPDAQRSSKGQAACQRQVRFWREQAAVTVITRPLHYRIVGKDSGEPRWEAREKGIDVRIAVDLVRGALNDEYDVAVLFSADSDLVPAAEAVLDSGKWMEFAAWKADGAHAPHLRVPGRRTWCHFLTRQDFDLVQDRTDYTVPFPEQPFGG